MSWKKKPSGLLLLVHPLALFVPPLVCCGEWVMAGREKKYGALCYGVIELEQETFSHCVGNSNYVHEPGCVRAAVLKLQSVAHHGSQPNFWWFGKLKG